MVYFKANLHRTAISTKKRLKKTHQYFTDNPGCTIDDAVAFIPETQYIVEHYSKNREKYTKEFTDEILKFRREFQF